MRNSYVVIVIGRCGGGGTLVRRLALVGYHLLERMGMPRAETEAVHV